MAEINERVEAAMRAYVAEAKVVGQEDGVDVPDLPDDEFNLARVRRCMAAALVAAALERVGSDIEAAARACYDISIDAIRPSFEGWRDGWAPLAWEKLEERDRKLHRRYARAALASALSLETVTGGTDDPQQIALALDTVANQSPPARADTCRRLAAVLRAPGFGEACR